MFGEKTISASNKKRNYPLQRRRSRLRPFAVSLFTGLFLIGGGSVGDTTAGEVWVANMKCANVQVIDTDSYKVVKTIPTGAGAHNVTFSPDGKLAFIANLGTNSITIIDTASKEKLADEIGRASCRERV